MNSENTKFSPFFAVGTFAIFLIVALAPRLGLVLAGASYADDWGHGYVVHFHSYRPVAAVELWLMQSIFGADYLTFAFPKLLSAIWYALSLTILMHVAQMYHVPRMLFILLGVATLLHPSFNEFILWGVLSTSATALLLCVSGASIAYLSGSSRYRFAGIVLMCLGAAANQLASTVGACLVATELAHRGVAAVLADRRKEIVWRLAIVSIPPICALLILVILRNIFGYSDFESRTIGFSSTDGMGYLRDKFYVFSNAIANLYQAPIGVVFGANIALRAFWPIVFIPIPLLAVLLIWSRVTPHRAIFYALSIPTVIAISLSPLLAATAMPTGYRILNNLILVLCFVFAVALTPFWTRLKSRTVVIVAIILIGVSFAWASLTDIEFRKEAWRQDMAWLEEAKANVMRVGVQRLSLCSWRFSVPVESLNRKEGIIVSYRHANALTYSVWYTQFLVAFLRIQGLVAEAPESDKAPYVQCGEMCVQPGSGYLGPHALVLDSASSTAFVCPARSQAFNHR